jgi:DNA repair protein RecO (recombination protein O)
VSNYKVDGIILKTRDFGEADRIVVMIDRRLGKVEAVAKGARRPRSVLRGPCQAFSYNQFLIWQGRSLDGISQCEVVESFSGLRDDLLKLAVASYMAEMVDEVVREGDPSPEVFDLLLGSFRWLGSAEPSDAGVTLVLRAFDLRLLGLGGFAPVLEACATCGLPAGEWVGPGGVAFSPAAGGIVCPSCRVTSVQGADNEEPSPTGPPVTLLAAGTLAAMRHLARATPELARVLRLTPRAAMEMERALRSHIIYHLDRRPKSLDFLDAIRK